VTGERLFNGIPLGASLSASHGHLYLFNWVFGKDKNLEDINFGADLDTYTAELALYPNAENADLTSFETRGGKLIATTGAADSVVPLQATIDHYERVVEHFGGLEKARSFIRLYLVPGMAHGGGPGVNQTPNLLDAVRAWRERGVAPGALTGRHVVNGKAEWEMPLQPYPQKTGWNAKTASFEAVDGQRAGVERVAERFRPAAK